MATLGLTFDRALCSSSGHWTCELPKLTEPHQSRDNLNYQDKLNLSLTPKCFSHFNLTQVQNLTYTATKIHSLSCFLSQWIDSLFTQWIAQVRKVSIIFDGSLFTSCTSNHKSFNFPYSLHFSSSPLSSAYFRLPKITSLDLEINLEEDSWVFRSLLEPCIWFYIQNFVFFLKENPKICNLWTLQKFISFSI